MGVAGVVLGAGAARVGVVVEGDLQTPAKNELEWPSYRWRHHAATSGN